MKKSIILLSLAASMLLSSCGFHNLCVTPSVALDSNNFEYVRKVHAEKTFTYVFGIGGLVDRNPMNILNQQDPLNDGEAYANISVYNTSKIYLGIVIVKTINVDAWIVRYTGANSHQTKVDATPQASSLMETPQSAKMDDGAQDVNNTSESKEYDEIKKLFEGESITIVGQNTTSETEVFEFKQLLRRDIAAIKKIKETGEKEKYQTEIKAVCQAYFEAKPDVAGNKDIQSLLTSIN